MKTLQRIYLYTVWLVSLEMSTWAAIHLLRTLASSAEPISRTERLASASAFLLVGLLVFILHAWLISRQAASEEERFSRTRATVFYAATLSLYIPAIQNLLAGLQRSMAPWFDLPLSDVIIGGSQTWTDNLVALLISVPTALLVQRQIAADWQAQPGGDSYREMRRAWRYAWLVYAVGMTAFGAGDLVQVLMAQFIPTTARINVQLVNGISLLLVGALLWWFWRLRIRLSLAEPAEAQSSLRLVVLYLLALVPAFVAVWGGRYLLHLIAQTWLSVDGRGYSLDTIREVSGTVLPAITLWLVYQRALGIRLAQESDRLGQAAMRRLYTYVLAALGLTVTLIGLVQLADPLAASLQGRLELYDYNLSADLSWGLASLLVGPPLWLRHWRRAQRQAAGSDELAEDARRAQTRRAYLYLSLLTGILGVMNAAGSLIFYVLMVLLGRTRSIYSENMLVYGYLLLVFGALLAYHWLALRADRRAQAADRQEQLAAFKVVVLHAGVDDFAAGVSEALRSEAPQLPVVIYDVRQPLPQTLAGAGAVILPATLSLQLGAEVSHWLANFNGARLVVPDEAPQWVWIGAAETSPEPLRKQAARLALQAAEGEPVSTRRYRLGWTVMGYIFALLLGLIAAVILFSLAIELFISGA